jgi:D-alanyl-lipoteichoic acid acyltransferase DltB (MBOAT superfamily)
MVFSSINYLLFLLVVTLVYYLIPQRLRWIWIILSSIFFYISFVPIFIFLIAGIIVLNYYIAIRLNKLEQKRKNRFFIKAILINVFILAFFKYFDFFQGSFNSNIFNWKIIRVSEPLRRWIIPLGLSYFIFTILSYLIEVKREKIAPERHLGIFSAYLLFFPKIAQGPIERPQNLIPQFHQLRPFDYDRTIDGLKLMLWGYFKKLVVADRLALYVNAVFNNSENHNGTTLAVATIYYAFQIYADFSGYTDIALGSAEILGFKLTNNFNRPYFSTSIKEFWNRWHITFSTWIRDYLFLPLAYYFSNKLKKEKYFKIATEKWIYFLAAIITFTIAGIWHGDGLNYLAWGLLFGIYLTYSNWTNKLNRKIRKEFHISKFSIFYKISKIFSTFFLVSLAWIFFRASDLSTAFSIIGKIFTRPGSMFIGDWQQLFYSLAAIAFLILIEMIGELVGTGNLPFKTNHWFKEQLAYAVLVILILLVGVFDGGQFIYFQF